MITVMNNPKSLYLHYFDFLDYYTLAKNIIILSRRL